MTPDDRWQLVQKIFLDAADLPPGERSSALDRMCRGDGDLRTEVESLLRSDSGDEEGLSGAIETEAASLLEAPSIAGSRMGPYRVVREIGRGGMGSVYLAIREDEEYESEVAIKVVRPGFDTDFILRRFRRERQILARLQHPNIARLFDGGTTEDRIPYIVMEYIRGSWITHYVREHHLSLEERLTLFLPVCSAVEYVHRAFIVHRDLKPGNILVDSGGTPKLLDFGISKLLRFGPRDPAETQAVGFATPDYASPEQVLGEPVTIATDVYSLGAVLYELLTGLRPHRLEGGAQHSVERAICQEPIPAPSEAVRTDPALARRLAGDVDAIILRAMEKEPARRYETVEHLAEDLRLYLNQQPTMARRDVTGQSMRRAFARNPETIAVAGLAGAATVAWIGLRHLFRTSRKTDDLKRELLSAYAHMGACADRADSLRAYTAMAGIAQLGLATALPPDRTMERKAALEKAYDLLRRARHVSATGLPSMGSVARAWFWAAHVYLSLAESGKAERRKPDESMARMCLLRALAEWRRLEPTCERDIQEMEVAAAMLADLEKRGSAR